MFHPYLRKKGGTDSSTPSTPRKPASVAGSPKMELLQAADASFASNLSFSMEDELAKIERTRLEQQLVLLRVELEQKNMLIEMQEKELLKTNSEQRLETDRKFLLSKEKQLIEENDRLLRRVEEVQRKLEAQNSQFELRCNQAEETILNLKNEGMQLKAELRKAVESFQSKDIQLQSCQTFDKLKASIEAKDGEIKRLEGELLQAKGARAGEADERLQSICENSFTKLVNLETENRNLKAEAGRLRECVNEFEVVAEAKRGLEVQLKKFDKIEDKAIRLEIENANLIEEIKSLKSGNIVETPSAIMMQLALAKDKIGELTEKLIQLEDVNGANRAQMGKLAGELDLEKGKNANNAIKIDKLARIRMMSMKEIGLLKDELNKQESHGLIDYNARLMDIESFISGKEDEKSGVGKKLQECEVKLAKFLNEEANPQFRVKGGSLLIKGIDFRSCTCATIPAES